MQTTSTAPSELYRQPLKAFKPLFKTLSPPEAQALKGIYFAEFTGPWWLRRSAGPSLAIAGMGGWCGKEFYGDGTGVNLLRQGDRLERKFPLRLAQIPSLVDGQPGLTVQYTLECPFPWPHVIDELRWLDGSCLLGLTIVKAGFLRHFAFPFLLKAQDLSHGL